MCPMHRIILTGRSIEYRKMYEVPVSQLIEVAPAKIICGSNSVNKCPKCGSSNYTEMEVSDTAGKIGGYVFAAIATFLNPQHGAHMVHHAAENKPKKKVRICKKCGHEWDA